MHRFNKRSRSASHTYGLIVSKSKETNWHWLALLLLDNEVLTSKKPIVNERQEAMKEAHFMANHRERLPEDYPQDYTKGWRELAVLPTGLVQ